MLPNTKRTIIACFQGTRLESTGMAEVSDSITLECQEGDRIRLSMSGGQEGCFIETFQQSTLGVILQQ